jgi:GTP pyrophosphokinase
MDFKHLEQFFDYQPTFDDDPTFLVEKIIQSASNYLSNHEETIRKAYHFSRDSHSSGKRLSGEPYIVHPLLSTLFLMEIKPDLPSIITCILHDVIEDTPVEYDDVKKLFGQEVADLCE